MSVHHMNAVPLEARRRDYDLSGRNYSRQNAIYMVVGTEPSSRKEASALNS